MEQAKNPGAYRDGLREWFRGETTFAADAAGYLFADTVRLIREALTKKGG